MKTITEVEDNSPLLVEVYDNLYSNDYEWIIGRTTGNVRRSSEEIEVSITGEEPAYYHIGDEVRFKDEKTFSVDYRR